MNRNRPLLEKEYRLSELHDELDLSSVPDDPRSIHTLFAILINDIDRRADVHQSLKPEIMEGLAQVWLYFAENEQGVDVKVQQHQHGVDTEVDDPEDDRPASSIGRTGTEPSIFDESLISNAEFNITTAQFERDMRRLDDLRRKSSHPGLNTVEGKERDELLEQYDLAHSDWWQRNYLSESQDTNRSSAASSSTASISR